MARNEVFRVYKDEETLLKVYNARLRKADQEFEEDKADRERFFDRYRNKVEAAQVNDDGHRVTVTTGIGIVDTMYASMTAVDVEFLCSNIGHGTPEQAMAASRGLNQAWRDTKGQKRAKRAIKDAVIADVGWVKVYYDYVEDSDLQDMPKEALEQQLLDFFGEKASDVTEEQILAAAEAGDIKLVEDVTIVLRDRVCIDYVPWDKVRYDTSAKSIEDVRWVAQYTSMPEYEVKGNPTWLKFVKARYGERKGPKMLDDLVGDSTLTSSDPVGGEMLGGADDRELSEPAIVVVEMWDFETGLVTVHPKGNNELVLHQRENPLMFNLDLEDRNPFKPLMVRTDSTEFEGIGDMRAIYPGLEELDEYRSNEATYVARTIPKFFGPRGALTDSGKESFKSPVWGEYVELQEGVAKDAIGQVQIPSLPQESYRVPEQVVAEIRDATGVNEPMQGIFPDKRTTATETNIVTSRGDARQAERRGNLTDWYLSIAKTMLQLMQVFYDQERVLRFTDDLGQDFAWHWTKEDIAIEADIEIALTPSENLTRGERVQRALQLMNLALPLPETDRGQLMRFVAREMGFRDDEVRQIVKSDQEVKAEQAQQQVAQLGAAPQQSGSGPPGLAIRAG